jgi:hypothetical protein
MPGQQLFTISKVHRSDGAVNNSPKCRLETMVKDYTNNNEVEFVWKDVKRKHVNVDDEYKHVMFIVSVGVAGLLV